ncbi:MAG: sulfatase-like hydrolase/transferase [Myxococcota bacterium]
MRRFAIGALVVVVALAGTAYAFRKPVILYLIANVARNASVVAPNQEIVWASGPAAAEAPIGQRPPNIVLILADDMGINDISFFGGGVAGGAVPTPSIDSLAREGVSFDVGYAGNATCAPSRAAILTGRYPTRFGFEFTPTPRGMGRILELFYNDGTRPHELLYDPKAAEDQPDFADQGVPGSELTIAELLAPRGYHSMHIGKWHLGTADAFSPNAQGFDESVLMESGLYLEEADPQVVNAKLAFDPIDQFLWARMQYATSYNGGEVFAPRGYLTDFYTDEAVKAIEANRNRPFFLYLAHWGVHSPLQAAKADYDALAEIENPRLRVYAAMMRALDRSVGRVLKALDDNGLSENTLVIFTSDNGGAGYIGLPDVNQPYRGWKLTFFEGGIRAPFFVKWPGRIAPGTRNASPIAHIDVLPTLVAAAGAALPTDRPIDGVNLLPFIDGSAQSGEPHAALFWRSGYYQAVRANGWKLQVSDNPRKAWLFDLGTDPTEQLNLAEQRPEKLAELRALLDEHNAKQAPPLYPAAGQIPVLVDKTLEQGGTVEDEYIYWPG